jgi:hypothetical protein
MKTTDDAAPRYLIPILLAITLVIALVVAGRAMAASPDAASMASQYATWAGGKPNADALVTGMRNGTTITLTTMSPDRTISIAGFTPRAAMGPEEISRALSGARSALARLGIHQPTAEQIQAALIGGEVELRDGGSTIMNGTVAVRGGTSPPPGRVATSSR